MRVGGVSGISQGSASNAIQVKVLIKQRDQLQTVVAKILDGIKVTTPPSVQTDKGQLLNKVV